MFESGSVLNDNKLKLIIAAIDFGTTYSGYAYAFRHNLQTKDVKTSVNARRWINELANTSTDKTPTSILFTRDGEFHSFGYEAENKYAELADDDEHKGWRFFKHIKMKLHNTKIGRNTRIKDDQGKNMLALDVFAAAIRYLKNDAMDSFKNKVPQIKETDVFWVITVPAIWTYKAKQFMKEAAEKAGLSSDQVCLTHEPEAAAIYSRLFDVDKTNDFKLSPLKEGSKFMILDLGGGTVDITTYEVQGDGTLTELCPRGGGPWGGNVVNENLYNLFINMFGEDMMEAFSNENKYDHLQLMEALELKKRLTGETKNAALTVKDVRIVVQRALFEMYKKKHSVELKEKFSDPQKFPNVKRDKICFAKKDFEDAFENSMEQLIREIKSLLLKNNLHNVNTFMMVGGFAESPIMQRAVRNAFQDKNVIIPEEASTAVLKGAVVYGYKNSLIRSRKMPYTFGVSTAEKYDPDRHPSEIKSPNGKVEDIFSPFLQKGIEIRGGNRIVVEKMFNTPVSGCIVEIYQTPSDELPDPVFTNDERFQFERIGTIRFEAKPGQLVDVKMMFGIFDVEVAVKVHGTNDWINKTFDAL